MSFGNICYAFCCTQCAVGSVLSDSMSMDFYLGCCCVNCFLSRNLIRYHYHIQGGDCFEECAVPVLYNGALCCFVSCVGLCCWPCLPCLIPIGVLPLVLFLSTQLQEVNGRGKSYGYIIGYVPQVQNVTHGSPAVATVQPQAIVTEDIVVQGKVELASEPEYTLQTAQVVQAEPVESSAPPCVNYKEFT